MEIPDLNWKEFRLYLSHLMWVFMCFATEILIQGIPHIPFNVLPDNGCVKSAKFWILKWFQIRDCKPLFKKRKEIYEWQNNGEAQPVDCDTFHPHRCPSRGKIIHLHPVELMHNHMIDFLWQIKCTQKRWVISRQSFKSQRVALHSFFSFCHKLSNIPDKGWGPSACIPSEAWDRAVADLEM